VAIYTYQATRRFVNGVYSGTSVFMEFVSKPDPRLLRIRWGASLQGLDEELEGLRAHISKVLAAAWLEALSAGNPVPWTANLRLLPDGIEFRPSGMFGHKDWTKAAYSDLAGTNMDKGVFYLFLKGQKGACTSEQVSASNFFPGYLALNAILQGPRTS
jgi:hypothetical protein